MNGIYATQVACYEDVLSYLEADNPSAGYAQVNRGNAICKLAKLGIESEKNLCEAIMSYEKALGYFEFKSTAAGIVQLNKGNAALHLAEFGIESEKNYVRAVEDFGGALDCFDLNTPNTGNALMNRGNALCGLAELGRDSESHLFQAVADYREALECFSESSFDVAKCHINLTRAFTLRFQLITTTENKQIKILEAAEEHVTEAVVILEGMGGSIQNENSRKAFREQFATAYRQKIKICLELAQKKTSKKDREFWLNEAWTTVQLTKSRTLRESFEVIQQISLGDEGTWLGQLMDLIPELAMMIGQKEEESDLTSQEQCFFKHFDQRPSIGIPEFNLNEHWMENVVHHAPSGRYLIVIEFFPWGQDIGVFVLSASKKDGLDSLKAPLKIQKGSQELAWLCRRLQFWNEVRCMCDSGESRVRNGKGEFDAEAVTLELDELCRRYVMESPLQTSKRELILLAKTGLSEVIAELGELLAPLRNCIHSRREWKGASLVICPTGELNQLPLSAIPWEGEEPLIASHPVSFSPTAALLSQYEDKVSIKTEDQTACLLGYDGEGSLPYALEEIRRVNELLTSQNWNSQPIEDAKAHQVHELGAGVERQLRLPPDDN